MRHLTFTRIFCVSVREKIRYILCMHQQPRLKYQIATIKKNK